MYTLYGTPLGPGAAADLAAFTTYWTSLLLGSLVSNSVVGGRANQGSVGAKLLLSQRVTQGVMEEVVPPSLHPA